MCFVRNLSMKMSLSLKSELSCKWILVLLFGCWPMLLTSAQGRIKREPAHVVGGKPAVPKEFPHMARLGNRNDNNVVSWFCGGTLISNSLVLTAAHCFYSESGSINVVRLGELDFASSRDNAAPEDFGVRKRIEHPEFKYPSLYNDIALIELDRKVQFSEYKQPVCLPSEDSDSPRSFIATGWGQTKFAGAQSSSLQKVTLRGYQNNCDIGEDIEELSRGFDPATQLCVGSSLARDTCLGDSGGPLLTFLPRTTCRHQVRGITSVGLGCGTPNVPSLYTRVQSYLGWIRQEMAKVP